MAKFNIGATLNKLSGKVAGTANISGAQPPVVAKSTRKYGRKPKKVKGGKALFRPKSLREVYDQILGGKAQDFHWRFQGNVAALAKATLNRAERNALGLRKNPESDTMRRALGTELAMFGLLGISPLGSQLAKALKAGKVRVISPNAKAQPGNEWPFDGVEIPSAEGEDWKDPEILMIPVGYKPKDLEALKRDTRVIEAQDATDRLVREVVAKATREDLVRLLALAGERTVDAKVLGDSFVVKGKRENPVFTLTDSGVFVDGVEVVRHAYVAGNFYSADLGDAPWGWAYLMVAQALNNRKDRGGIKAFFRDHPGFLVDAGEKSEEETTVKAVMSQNKVFTVKAEPQNGFKLKLVKDRALSHPAGVAALVRGLPVAWHHQLEWVCAGNGAKAMGVGRDAQTGEVRILAESTTLTKLNTRIKACFTLACVMAGSEDSAIRFRTGDGIVSNRGVRLSVALVDSPFANEGDGMSFLLNGKQIGISGQRSFELQVESLTGLTGGAAVKEVKGRLAGSVKTPSYGDKAVLLDGVPQYFWDLLVPGALEGVTVAWNEATQAVDVKFTYAWQETSPKGKLTTLGWKTMAMPKATGSIFFKGMKETELVAGPNAVKATDALRSMWAASYPGGVVVDPDVGYTAEQVSDFDNWVKASATTEWVKFVVACPDALAELKAANPESDDVRYLDHGVVYHRCTVYRGEVVLTVESTSVVEAVGSTSLFSETLLGRYASVPAWAMETWNRKGGQMRKAYDGLFKALAGKANREVDLLEESLRVDGKTQKEILKALAKAYPGVTLLRANDSRVCVSFEALARLDNWMPGGMTRGPSRFVAAIARAPEGTKPQWFVEQLSGIANLMDYAVKEGKALATPLKAGKLMQRKVVTSWACPRGRALVNLMDPQVQKGEIRRKTVIAVQRNPMVSCLYARVEYSYSVPVGLILVNPIDWAIGNNGDTDGDQAIWEVIPARHAKAAKEAWAPSQNPTPASMLGPNGYFASTSGYKPYVKAMFTPKGGIKPAGAYTGSVFSVDTYAETVGEIGKHYRVNVGVGYALASRALYRLIQLQERGKETMEDAMLVAWTWRIFYEDRGLSGWSEANAEAYAQVKKAAEAGEGEEAQAIQELVAFFNKGDAPITPYMAEMLIRVYHQYELGKQVAKGKLDQTHSPLVRSAAMYHFIRSASKGRIAGFSLDDLTVRATKGLLGEYLKVALPIQEGALQFSGKGGDLPNL